MTIRLNGSTSGYTEIDCPAVGGNNNIKLPTGNGSTYQIVRNGATAGSLEFTDKIVSGTAVASTSGTAIDFTGIPSWVKRVTVMFNGVSTSGTSNYLIQIGSGSIASSGYVSQCQFGTTSTSFTTGFCIVFSITATNTVSGSVVVNLLGSNTYVENSILASPSNVVYIGGGSVTLSGTLDRVRITTTNGTDTFDAGSINLLW